MDKPGLRKHYQQRRQSLSSVERQAVSQALVDHWQSWPMSQQCLRIGSYLATPQECPTDGLHQFLWQQQQRVFVPVLSQARLGLVEYHSHSLLVPTNKPGIVEPQTGEVTPLNELDVLLIPLLAMDARGYRLGYGSGYYDRLLSGQRPPLIGLGYHWQWTEQLPHDAWDIPLDGFLSERGWLFCNQLRIVNK